MTGEYAQMLVQCGDVQLGIYLEAKLPLVDRLKQNDFVACDDIGSHRFAVDRQLWEESFDHGEIEILDSVSNDFAGGKVSDLGFGNRRKKRREEARDAFAQRRLNRRQRFGPLQACQWGERRIDRSAERRGGKESVRTCRYRWSP